MSVTANLLTSHYEAVRRLLVTDIVILSRSQVTRTTFELASTSPNFHTAPMGERLGLDRLNAYQPPLHSGSSAVQGSNS
ncbi:hypothetical protein TNCV_2840301 [Trichonephila clavipes]|uniref:Uncharacterized protein n=1 Tax=Trichonephila clavipes TaxID=2585209 RepID=A0A8X6RW09_TRICX|nr:hypothetical protein TNCV_2840301 [Trichonephila clavipes]